MLTFIGMIFTLFSTLLAPFLTAHKIASKDFHKLLNNSLNSEVNTNNFVNFYDSTLSLVFGKKYFSKRSLLMSFAFTLLSLIAFSSISQFSYGVLRDEQSTAALWAGWLFWAFLTTAIADYLSCIQTRILVKKMLKSGHIKRYLILDIALTLVIYYQLVAFVYECRKSIFSEIRTMDVNNWSNPSYSDWSKLVDIDWGNLFYYAYKDIAEHPLWYLPIDGWYPTTTMFLSTFFASIWMWIFWGAYRLILKPQRIRKVKSYLKKYSTIKNSDIYIIGISFSFVATLSVAIIILWSLLLPLKGYP